MRTTINSHAKGLPYYLVGGGENVYAGYTPNQLRKAQETILESIAEALPKNPIIWVSLEDAQQHLCNLVDLARTKFPGHIVISLSSLYCNRADAFLECNRITDVDGKTLGVGARPGSKPLSVQISEINKRFPGKRFILVDDTLFHGESMFCLQEAGLKNVDCFAVCFATKEGTERLRVEFGMEVLVHEDLGDFLDLLPLHDFIPYSPLCGKVIGQKTDSDGCLPEATFINGLSLSLPYLQPYITAQQVETWASIPANKALLFSRTCLTVSINIYRELGKKGYFPVYVKDLLHIRPRSSHPYRQLIVPSRRIVELLEEDLSTLNM